jgi:CspA family cold shock protein
MPLGTIKTLTEKGFGFIETGRDDLFFHSRSVQGRSFDSLYRGQTVGYTEGRGPQGPRAENVKAIN